MSKPVSQFIIKLRNRSQKNLELSRKVNVILKNSFSEFQDAVAELAEIKDLDETEIDLNVINFTNDVWQQFAEAIEISNAQTEGYQEKFDHFEKEIRTRQKNS